MYRFYLMINIGKIVFACSQVHLWPSFYIQLSHLRLIDKLLSTDGYRKLAQVLVATSCQSLGLESCNLNKDYIVSLQHGFQEQNFQVCCYLTSEIHVILCFVDCETINACWLTMIKLLA